MSENKLKQIHVKVTFEWDDQPRDEDYPKGTTDDDVIRIEKNSFDNDIFLYIEYCPNDPVIEITTINEKE